MHSKKIMIFTRRANLGAQVARVCETAEAELVMSNLEIEEMARRRFNGCDLVIVDVTGDVMKQISQSEMDIAEGSEVSLLLVVPQDMLDSLRLPVQINCDFVCDTATDAELFARIRNLLWPGEETSANDFIKQGPLTLNLATYQVKIDGEPVDFTYLGYALLAFLVTHPGHTYSRDALLNRVWDFDYYGGSRTVDVHVRRIRAKLGPDLAQYLKTVRGVGYLWSY